MQTIYRLSFGGRVDRLATALDRLKRRALIELCAGGDRGVGQPQWGCFAGKHRLAIRGDRLLSRWIDQAVEVELGRGERANRVPELFGRAEHLITDDLNFHQ